MIQLAVAVGSRRKQSGIAPFQAHPDIVSSRRRWPDNNDTLAQHPHPADGIQQGLPDHGFVKFNFNRFAINDAKPPCARFKIVVKGAGEHNNVYVRLVRKKLCYGPVEFQAVPGPEFKQPESRTECAMPRSGPQDGLVACSMPALVVAAMP